MVWWFVYDEFTLRLIGLGLVAVILVFGCYLCFVVSLVY